MDRLIYLGEYRALEQALWREIGRIQKDDPLAPATVVAPTGRLVRRLKIEAARRFPNGLLHIRFANLFQFALDHADADFHPNPILAERILLRFLERTRGAGAPTYDLAGAFRAAIRDLKDAAAPPDPAFQIERLREAVGEEERGEAETRLTVYDIEKFGRLLRAYVEYERERSRLPLTDLPDVFLRAAERIRISEPLLVYGFYDVTQVQADFLKAAAAQAPVSLFIPHGDGDAWKFNAWFRTTFAPMISGSFETLESLPPLRPEVRNAAGERDEVIGCAKEIRRLLDGGIPAGEIAFLARTLDPYLPHVEEVFADHRIPTAVLPGRPLNEHPLARVVRLLFHAARQDFPRASVLEILLHPLFRVEGDRRHWDRLVRNLRIGRGEDWKRLGKFTRAGITIRSGRESDEDHRTLAIPARDVADLVRAFRRLASHRRPAKAGWKEQVRAHRKRLDDFDEESATEEESLVLTEIRSILGRIEELDALGERITPDKFLDAFDREFDRARIPRPPSNGVAVLDAMAARGLSFRRVFLVGLNAHVFPRFIVEEPFVSDSVRRHVLRVPGHHLPVRRDGYDEERLLFHLACSAATEGLVCFYQRADDRGRQRDPSPFLRPFLGDRKSIPAIPRGVRARLERETILTPKERILVARDPAPWLRTFGGNADAFERSRRFFTATLEGGELSGYEGRVGARPPVKELSPTRLERYASCPFQYFAMDVLRIFPREEREEVDDLTPREIGTLQHRMLEFLYRSLQKRDFRGYDLDAEVERAAKQAFRDFERKTGIPLAGLLAARRDRIAASVRAFAAWDLARFRETRPVKFEQSIEGNFAGIRFHGKIDRADRGAGFRVVDYKRRSGASWNGSLLTKARRGEKLQAPLYLELTGADEAEFLFVEDCAETDPDLREPRKPFTKKEWNKVRPDVDRAVRVLSGSMEQGWFFVRPDEGDHGSCSYCDFPSVCRKQLHRAADRARESGADYWNVVKEK